MIEGVGSFTAQDKSKTLLHAERDGLRKSQTPALVTGSAENAPAFVAEVVLASRRINKTGRIEPRSADAGPARIRVAQQVRAAAGAAGSYQADGGWIGTGSSYGVGETGVVLRDGGCLPAAEGLAD